MRLVLEEPFKRLWSGRDPFEAVEALQGKVYRELEGAAPCAPRSTGAATSSRSTVASAGARSPRTCSPPSSRCSARARSGRPSGACTRPA